MTGHELVDLPLSVGADPGCDLVLPDLPARAGEIHRSESGTLRLLEDGGARTRRLRPETWVELGPHRLLVTSGAEASAPPGEGALLLPVLDLATTLWGRDAEEEAYAPLLEALLAALGARWGAIVRPGDPDPEVVAHAGSRPAGAGTHVSRTVLAELEGRDEPVLGEDVVKDAGLGAIASIPGEVRSVVAARLVHDGETEGVVYLESPRAKRTFTAAEAALLARLGSFAAGSLARARRAARLDALHHAEVAREHDVTNIVGESAPMQALASEVEKAAGADVTALVLGPSGTGKELVAKAIHAGSARARGPFVAVNCAGIPEGLVESELFGHEKGAFTGAAARRIGRFELAHGGTLFLDELADLPLGSQGKLLRALEERVVQRLGGRNPRPVDVRVVAATNADLQELVAEGRFREDLYYRLAVFVLHLPPLRDRGEDVLLLAEHFLAQFCRKHRRELAGFDEGARAMLVAHPWPGNVRELRNVIEQAVLRADGDRVGKRSLASIAPVPADAAVAASPDRLPLADARALFERDYITRTLRETRGDMKEARLRLGVSQTTLYDRCKALGIEPAEFRG